MSKAPTLENRDLLLKALEDLKASGRVFKLQDISEAAGYEQSAVWRHPDILLEGRIAVIKAIANQRRKEQKRKQQQVRRHRAHACFNKVEVARHRDRIELDIDQIKYWLNDRLETRSPFRICDFCTAFGVTRTYLYYHPDEYEMVCITHAKLQYLERCDRRNINKTA